MTSAAELVANAELILLDFDGPVTKLLPPPLNSETATQLKKLVQPPPSQIAATTDHLAVLRHIALATPDLLVQAEQEATLAEVRAARLSQPTPGVRELIDLLLQRGQGIAIITNNAAVAVRTFLEANTLPELKIYGRPSTDLNLMKPNPYLIQQAVKDRGAAPGDAVMVGDSPSDIEAAHRAGTASIGFITRPTKAAVMQEAMASEYVTDISQLLPS